MEGATDREREVANCLFQIEKLTGADARAVLRLLATDDATFSEAQCSHIARVVDGTLHKNPRDAINAWLTCASALEAAINWEKTFASYARPGHVSFGLRNCGAKDPDNMQTDVFLQEQPDAYNNQNVGDGMTVALLGPKDSFDSTNYPGIINRGHMTVHYHHHHHHHYNDYNHSSPDQSIPSIVPQKRERDEEDEQYAKAMNALLGTYEPGADVAASTSPSKRARLQEPEAETYNTEPEKVKAEVETGQLLLVKDSETKTKTMQGKTCKYCGVQFTKRHNKPQRGGALPCRHHVGDLVPYSPGINVGTSSNVKMLYQAWNCCDAAPADLGCVFTRHKAK
ncbi:hypothetical protein VP1G_08716 [Cytospora mali]|uniref:Uncharacterized protein n=1 Tax=Cytospora mali TaxID=578113 RepID=A0A194VCF5_CYTMA|nr:hypothetical protein VP1G_08716 [Valsa mali var. pyri (nom. inval.)]